MSYQLLRDLYFGMASNAELTDHEALAKLHVETGLDEHIPAVLRGGRDLVITGNPGDGKTHLARALGPSLPADLVTELDLSAQPFEKVAGDWSEAAGQGRPFLMCANEGPLRAFLQFCRERSLLPRRASECLSQLGRLEGPVAEDLAERPELVELVDLADRNVLAPEVVSSALGRVARRDFLPQLRRADETGPGRCLRLLSRSPSARDRLARLICTTGQRMTEHVTFRQLWAALSYAITQGKKETTLQSELSSPETIPDSPLEKLLNPRGQGRLLVECRRLADPATVVSPELDEELWSRGEPRSGAWLREAEDYGFVSCEIPFRMAQRDGQEGLERALKAFVRTKRLVALAHDAGEALVQSLCRQRSFVDRALDDERLRDALLRGLRRLFVTAEEQERAGDSAAWLDRGLPLWVSNTYRDVEPEKRCYVAARCLPPSAFSVLRPSRVPWLSDALGPHPGVVWLRHDSSGAMLRVEGPLQELLEAATETSGPAPLPPPVVGFLARVSGACEQAEELLTSSYRFAVLEQPRGALVTVGEVRVDGSGRKYFG